MTTMVEVWTGSTVVLRGESNRDLTHHRRLSLPNTLRATPSAFPNTSGIMGIRNNVIWGKKYAELPCERLATLPTNITVATTGPGEGIQNVPISGRSWEKFRPPGINGRIPSNQLNEWTRRDSRAYGMATSLYEHSPARNSTVGDPVADVYAIVARENSTIMSIADGVNWGEKSRLAARCAVAGSVQYLNQYLSTAETTHDVMSLLLQSFELGQTCIIEKDATMTTLCTAVVCEIRGSDKWALCMVNVGDSLGYVYSEEDGTREVTIGSHCSETNRDMRCPGGSLGPVDGYNPDLRNLTFSYTEVSAGDIVFLTSDGVSDNFDPVVSQCNHCQGQLQPSLSAESICDRIRKKSIPGEKSKTDMDLNTYSYWDIPSVRHQKSLSDMREVIELASPDDHLSAQGLCANLISYVCKCTNAKRSFIERVDIESPKQNPLWKPKGDDIRRMMKELPGKLDHACVVAFEVGEFPVETFRIVAGGTSRQTKESSIFDKIKETVQGLTNHQSPDAGKTELMNLLAPH